MSATTLPIGDSVADGLAARHGDDADSAADGSTVSRADGVGSTADGAAARQGGIRV